MAAVGVEEVGGVVLQRQCFHPQIQLFKCCVCHREVAYLALSGGTAGVVHLSLALLQGLEKSWACDSVG